MIEVSKSEAFYLGDLGYEWKNHIHVTHGVKKKYYVTESKKLLMDLERFRRSKRIEF